MVKRNSMSTEEKEMKILKGPFPTLKHYFLALEVNCLLLVDVFRKAHAYAHSSF